MISLCTAIRILIVPAILSVVAAIHMLQWYSVDRSSWGTGAGFGMFATVDYHGSRFLRCYGITARGEYALQLPDPLKELSLSARVIPTRDRLAKLASKLLATEWSAPSVPETDSPLTLVPASNVQGIDATVQVSGVRVELWGVQICAPKRRVEGHMINQVTISRNTREPEPSIFYSKGHVGATSLNLHTTFRCNAEEAGACGR